MRTAQGISLVELLIACALVATLAGAAVPVLRAFLLDARMTNAVNALVHSIHVARTAAHTRRGDVVICRIDASGNCAPPGNWAQGWITFGNLDRDDPPVVDPGEPVLHSTGRLAVASVTSNRRAYVLRPFSLRATNGTVVFCDSRGAAAARAVILSYSGRPRVSRLSATGRPLACPG